MSARPPSFRLLVAGIAWPPETFLRRLVEGLAAADVEVTVGSAQPPDGANPALRWCPMPGWEAHPLLRLARLAALAARAGRRGCRLVSAADAPRSWGERLRSWNQLLPFLNGSWDAVYFPWNSAAVACLPVLDWGTPVVVSCRGSQVSVAPYNPARAELKRGLTLTFNKAAAVHCVSEATLRDAVALGLDPAKARIIRPAVDPQRFRPGPVRANPNGPFRVITVGNLNWTKAHEWALLAIRQVADAGVDVRFDIIGDGQDRQRVLYTIHDLGLQDRVRWLGKQPPDKVLECVRQADAFLLSSHSEGISNAVLEAMACGVPIVTTDCGGMREAVTDGMEGFVVPLREAEAMAAALLKLAGDPELRRCMGTAARTRVERDFNLDGQIRQWVELYRYTLTAPIHTPMNRSYVRLG